MQRKNYFTHQAAAFSYEGRTRGKRIRYNYSDDDEGASAGGTSDGASIRRSERTSRAASNAPEAPRFTASGRQIKKPTDGRFGGAGVNGNTGTLTGAATPASIGSENGDPSLGPRKKSRWDGIRLGEQMDGAGDSEDSYYSQAEDEYQDNGEETDDDEMSVDNTVPEVDLIRGSFIVPLKYDTSGTVAVYLTKKEKLEITKQSSDDAIMEETIADDNTNKNTSPGPVDDPPTKELPVMETSWPMNGTAIAEIRSKAADAG